MPRPDCPPPPDVWAHTSAHIPAALAPERLLTSVACAQSACQECMARARAPKLPPVHGARDWARVARPAMVAEAAERPFALALPTYTLVRATCRVPCATKRLVNRRRGDHKLKAERRARKAPPSPTHARTAACLATVCPKVLVPSPPLNFWPQNASSSLLVLPVPPEGATVSEPPALADVVPRLSQKPLAAPSLRGGASSWERCLEGQLSRGAPARLSGFSCETVGANTNAQPAPNFGRSRPHAGKRSSLHALPKNVESKTAATP